MKNFVTLIVATLLSSGTVDAWSQQIELSIAETVAAWSEMSNVTLLPAARQAALDAMAREFERESIAVGVEPVEAAQFARSISAGASITTTSNGLMGKWETGEGQLSLSNRAQTEAVLQSLNTEAIALQLRRLPRITVIVSPVPPRDYMIHVNKQPNRARDRDAEVFAVEPGFVTVQVSRAQKQDCIWAGTLALGDEHEMRCDL